MLSLHKLYKADQQTRRRPVTWGPNGTPGVKCSGSVCFRHPNVDWTVHRAVPAIYDNAKPGSKTRRAIQKLAPHAAPKNDGTARYELSRRPKSFLQNTSPRWGQGNAPGLHGRKTVPLPKKQTIQVSGKTKVAVGSAAAGYVGYKAYQHRDQIKQKAATMHGGIHNAFHGTRGRLGAA